MIGPHAATADLCSAAKRAMDAIMCVSCLNVELAGPDLKKGGIVSGMATAVGCVYCRC